ncbi:hypothetical protein NE237_009959 [Protea cynaroides]|uniref:tRNA-splicing endonuclease subunit Sen54 N-terminal domain-containing protein n=1 Tax=Protea cynaroides TaxID=273540 RepID=A0A9Q0KZK0_9MAGN|nr:hypothetical protein NE237_009959 [Protea cynaroides]
MEVEDWETSSDGTTDLEVYLQDTDDEEIHYKSGSLPKLQFRKDKSKARWDAEMGMAEVIEKRGSLWMSMGVVRRSKAYCFIEEILYLAQIGALVLLDADDTVLSLKDICEKVAKGKNGCHWEAFKAYRHLNLLKDLHINEVRGQPPLRAAIESLEMMSNGIPLKFCHVDHGRVSYFSFDKLELPVLP